MKIFEENLNVEKAETASFCRFHAYYLEVDRNEFWAISERIKMSPFAKGAYMHESGFDLHSIHDPRIELEFSWFIAKCCLSFHHHMNRFMIYYFHQKSIDIKKSAKRKRQMNWKTQLQDIRIIRCNNAHRDEEERMDAYSIIAASQQGKGLNWCNMLCPIIVQASLRYAIKTDRYFFCFFMNILHHFVISVFSQDRRFYFHMCKYWQYQ